MKRLALYLSVFLCGVTSCVIAPSEKLFYDIQSPDGNLRVSIGIDSSISMILRDSSERLVDINDVYMELGDGRYLGQIKGGMLPLKNVKSKEVDHVIDAPFNRNASVVERYNEVTFSFKGYNLKVRVFDEGVAYRFVSKLTGEYEVVNENAEFVIPRATDAYMALSNAPRGMEYQCSFENTYHKERLSRALPDTAYLTPFLVKVGDKNIIVSDCDIRDYPGMFIKCKGKTLMGSFARVPSVTKEIDPRGQVIPVTYSDVIAYCRGPQDFPWRVFGYGDDKSLLSSNLSYLLGAPSKMKRVGRIEPGKVAWEWWNDWGICPEGFEPGINTETYKYYIDFASRFGIEYVVLDEGWSPASGRDIFKVVPEIDLPELVRYGEEKGVKLILWAVAYVLDKDLKKACDYYSSMGIKGFKVDFIDRDDQEAVNMVNRICKTAAAYDLVLDLHGMYKPAGLNRTYPNILNFEGVWGMEQMKWSDDDMVSYDLVFPFIRMWSGPVDYTQGAMRNMSAKDFRPDYHKPASMGTRARQVAEYVVFDSPLVMLCDSPDEYYADSLCTRYIVNFPTVFDRVVPLYARIGEMIVTAREKSGSWYIGGINGWAPADYRLKLNEILTEGKNYDALVFTDAEDSDVNPSKYNIDTLKVSSDSVLDIHMADGGGFAVQLTKRK